jgi:hypothetical protein
VSRYNWRNTLVNYAAISGVLAGFCVTFIALILSGRVADVEIYPTTGVTLTFGNMAVLLFGVSAGLFICSSELFLLSKEYDVYSLSKPYRQFLKENVVGKTIEEWQKFEDESTKLCRRNELLGRNFYNSAIFIIFFGLLFVLIPYNYVIAAIVFFLGFWLECWQMARK